MLTIILLMMVLGAALKWLAMIKKAPVRVKVRVNEGEKNYQNVRGRPPF